MPPVFQESLHAPQSQRRRARTAGPRGDDFPAPSSDGQRYRAIGNVEWTDGFWTGMPWLAYEVSGAQRYRLAAQRQVRSFHARQAERLKVDHHALGFLYSLSRVAAHRLTGDPLAAEAAMGAARMLLARFHPRAGVIQAWGELSDPAQSGRMPIDCNLNLPLLYWVRGHSGDPAFRTADRHIQAAARHIVRARLTWYFRESMAAITLSRGVAATCVLPLMTRDVVHGCAAEAALLRYTFHWSLLGIELLPAPKQILPYPR